MQRLVSMLDIELKFPVTQKRLSKTRAYPEVQLMSLIVVATKLSHPFDDIERLPTSEYDPTLVKMDWTKWREVMARKSFEGLSRGEEIKVTDTNVLNMNDQKLVDYLDWYQRIWIDESDQQCMCLSSMGTVNAS